MLEKHGIIDELLEDLSEEEKKNSLLIIKCLENGLTTDEEIAENIDIKLNKVRKILYMLYDRGIVSYRRSKDPKTQWYRYSWKFEPEKLEGIIKRKHEKIVRSLEKTLEFEKNNIFFECENGDFRCTFEEAMEYNFHCPKCNSKLEYIDNSEIINEIERKINFYRNNGSNNVEE